MVVSRTKFEVTRDLAANGTRKTSGSRKPRPARRLLATRRSRAERAEMQKWVIWASLVAVKLQSTCLTHYLNQPYGTTRVCCVQEVLLLRNVSIARPKEEMTAL